MGANPSKSKEEENGNLNAQNTSSSIIIAKRLKPSDGISGWVNVSEKKTEAACPPTVKITPNRKQLTDLLKLTSSLQAAHNKGDYHSTNVGLTIVQAMQIIKTLEKHSLTAEDRTLLNKAQNITNKAYTAFKLTSASPKDTHFETEGSMQRRTMGK